VHIQSPKHITSNILGTWGLMSIASYQKKITSPKLNTSIILGTWGLMHICSSYDWIFSSAINLMVNRIIKVLNKNFEPYSIISLNLTYLLSRPLGATQAKLKSCYSKVPVHLESINRPLGATQAKLKSCYFTSPDSY
jgi:hypothetical protein